MSSNPTTETVTHSDHQTTQATNSKIVGEWLDWLEKRNLATTTIYSYRRIAVSLIQSLDIASADHTALEQWAFRKRRTGKVGATAAIKRDMDVARSIYRFAFDRGMIDKNPSTLLITPKRKQNSPSVVKPDLFQAIFEIADEPTKILLAVMRYSGLRRAEVANLRWRNVTPYREDGTFRNVVRKGGGESTVVLQDCLTIFETKRPDLLVDPDLHGFIHSWIGVHKGGANNYVFPQSANGSVDWVNKRLKKLTKGKFTPHALRHTFGTDLAKMGIPLHILKDLMNHSDIDSTMVYIHTEKPDVTGWL